MITIIIIITKIIIIINIVTSLKMYLSFPHYFFSIWCVFPFGAFFMREMLFWRSGARPQWTLQSRVLRSGRTRKLDHSLLESKGCLYKVIEIFRKHFFSTLGKKSICIILLSDPYPANKAIMRVKTLWQTFPCVLFTVANLPCPYEVLVLDAFL